MYRVFKYRLYPNKTQEKALREHLETHRRLYNQALEIRRKAWEAEKKSLAFFDQCKWFTQEKKVNKFYAAIPVAAAQTTLNRLDKAYKRTFSDMKAGRKFGFPRFQARVDFCSFGINSTKSWSYAVDPKRDDVGRLYLQNVGENIYVMRHRPHVGELKTINIILEGDHWYVCFCCEIQDEPVAKSDKPAVGLDVGLESFLTTSDGKSVKNPRLLRKAMKKLRVAQRSLSRKKKGGSNRKKAVRVVRNINFKIRRKRDDFYKKVAYRLTNKYGLLAIEDLKIKNMVKNDRLSLSISDAGWYNFRVCLENKAKTAGAEVVAVDPKGTSQECSACGKVAPKKLSKRWHECSCGLSIHRDENAARNILRRALLAQAREEPAGPNKGL